MTFTFFIMKQLLAELRRSGFLQNKTRTEIENAVHQVLVSREFYIQQNEAASVAHELIEALKLPDDHTYLGASNHLSQLCTIELDKPISADFVTPTKPRQKTTKWSGGMNMVHNGMSVRSPRHALSLSK